MASARYDGGSPPLAAGGGRPATAVARRIAGPAAAPAGDSATHSVWLANAAQVIGALEMIRQFQDRMRAALAAVDGSRDQIAAVTAWSDRVTVTAGHIGAELARIDASLAPLIDAVRRAGGVEQVGSLEYHSDY